MNKMYKKIFCLILSVMIIAATIPDAFSLAVFDNQYDNLVSSDGLWEYKGLKSEYRDNISDSLSAEYYEAILTKYKGNEKQIVIPDMIDGYNLEAIGDGCFKNNTNIESVTINSNIRLIGNEAFYGANNLEIISFESGLNPLVIESNPFYETSLTDFVLPERTSSIVVSSLNGLNIETLRIPSGLKIPQYINIPSVKHLIIESDYQLPDATSEKETGIFSSPCLKRVDFYGEVLPGANTELTSMATLIGGYTFGQAITSWRGDFLNKEAVYNYPDFVFHYIPEDSIEEALLNIGYNKSYDYENSCTLFSVEAKNERYAPITDSGSESPEYIVSGDFEYVLNSTGEALITGYLGSNPNIVFPSEIDGFSVIAVLSLNIYNADENFKQEILSLSFPESVEYIGTRAFYNFRSLETVRFSESIKIIDTRAFYGCRRIKNIELPNILYLGPSAFRLCEGVNIIIPPTLKEIPPYAFAYPRYVNETSRTVTLNEGLIRIGKGAFRTQLINSTNLYDERLITSSGLIQTELSLPSTVKNIGEQSFYGANIIGDLIIPSGVKEIKPGAFCANSFLNSITLNEGLEIIDEDAFKCCNTNQHLFIPNSVYKIAERSFMGIKAAEITLPEGLEVIPMNAFVGCDIDKIHISDTVKTIDYDAFSASNIGEINIPMSVEELYCGFEDSNLGIVYYSSRENKTPFFDAFSYATIGQLVVSGEGKYLNNAFSYSNITGKVIINSGVEVIASDAFKCSGVTEVIIPETVSCIEKDAFYSCEKLETVDFLPLDFNTESKDYYAFEDCPNLHSFTFNNQLKCIPDYLIKNCPSLENITIPESVTDIGSYAFVGTGFKSIVIPAGVESIGNGCFENCSALATVVINGNIMLIGDNAFRGCDSLNEIYIADSVRNIGSASFAGCTSLEMVYMSKNVVYIPEGCFENCTALSSFTWESDSKLIGKLAFAGCTSLTAFNFVGIEKLYPNSFQGSGIGVASLGEARDEAAAALQIVETQSFMNCPGLQTVALGGNVNTVQSRAFANCENLETAIISDSVETISTDAFENCPKLTIYCTEQSYAYTYATENNIPVSTFVVAPIPNQTYTSKAIEPMVSVSVSGKPLSNGTDFKVKYSDNVNVGTATVKVSGINTYKAFSSVVNFAILTRNISETSISAVTDQTYTGSEITPALTITFNGNTLREGKDYNVIYTNNISAGKAKATVTGIGNFSGTVSVEFSIVETQSPSGNEGFAQRVLTFIKNVIAFIARIIPFIASLFNN